MTHIEITNLIIKLVELGLSSDNILHLIGFISTHRPSEEEFNKALEIYSTKN